MQRRLIKLPCRMCAAAGLRALGSVALSEINSARSAEPCQQSCNSPPRGIVAIAFSTPKHAKPPGYRQLRARERCVGPYPVTDRTEPTWRGISYFLAVPAPV